MEQMKKKIYKKFFCIQVFNPAVTAYTQDKFSHCKKKDLVTNGYKQTKTGACTVRPATLKKSITNIETE